MALRDVIGQERAIRIILGTLARERMPSAYLFSGESGIGKKFTALNLAKAVNCPKTVNSQQSLVISRRDNADSTEEAQTIDYRLIDCCDECSSCKKTDAGTHPDLLVIAPEKGEIRVDEIRAVEEALSFRPYEGGRKVVVIDDADAMNASAANAFLKTLEEPPDASLLMLISAHPDGLPETIRSRCSRINFLPLSSEACGRVIRKVLGPELTGRGERKRPEAIDGLLPVAVRLSMGRPGLAIVSDRLKERDQCVGLLRKMLKSESETWRDREEMEQWFEMVFLLLRDMAVLKIMEGDGRGYSSAPGDMEHQEALVNADIRDLIADISKKADIRDIVNIYDKMAFLKGQFGFNLNKAITWNYTSSIIKTAMGNA